MTRRGTRGFTAMEMMVVLLIASALAVMAYAAFGHQKPRQTLNGFTVELRSLLHGARQTALLSSQPVVVMVFPNLVTGVGTGRIITYRDGDGTVFNGAAAPNFAGYDPVARTVGAKSEILDVVDVPTGVVIGPANGWGAGVAMPAPFAGILLSSACSFCTGVDSRGAIVFDPSGTVHFQAGNGPPLVTNGLLLGASLFLLAKAPGEASTVGTPDVRTLVVSASTGGLQTLAWAP